MKDPYFAVKAKELYLDKEDTLKEAVKEAILEGEIPNEYEPAKEFVLKRAEKLGLKKI